MTTKRASEKPGEKPGDLVTQVHGGALRNGSQPGTNKGGSGRPPNELRGTLREILERVTCPLLRYHILC